LMKLLEEWMIQTKDPLLECFQNRDEPEFVEAYIQKLEEESNLRRKKEKPSNKTKNSKKKS